jgi:hypothetical protein
MLFIDEEKCSHFFSAQENRRCQWHWWLNSRIVFNGLVVNIQTLEMHGGGGRKVREFTW